MDMQNREGMMPMHDMEHGGMGHTMSNMGGMMNPAALKKRFWICLVLAVPVLLLSPMMGVALPFQLSFSGSDWVVLLFSTILYFYGGKPFLSGAKSELNNRKPAMMTLISLGITVAYGYSVYALVRNSFFSSGGHVMDFFWELATLIVIMLLGHWIEMRAMASAGSALQKLAALLPKTAAVIGADGEIQALPLDKLQKGQTVLVKAGERIPADGTIITGSTTVDESMVTGEARAVEKKQGGSVIGGSQNGNGTVQVRVTATGQDGFLAQISQLVGNAQSQKSRAETLSGRVAGWLFYIALAVGILALIVWLLAGAGFDTALSHMVSVLVIACPHALGLAIPLVSARATSLGAQNGLLVRKRQALEATPSVDRVLLDKTGTLTQGRFQVADVKSYEKQYANGDILAMAAGLEAGSNHPLAFSIVEKAKGLKRSIPKAEGVQALPGAGLQGELEGKKALLVNAGYLDKEGIPYVKALAKGYTVSYLVLDGKAAGMIAQGDSIKPGAKQLIQRLAARGAKPVMLTGDNPDAAAAAASQLGLDSYKAGLLPQDKAALVKQARQKGHRVMMVGDGVNDAPALAGADVGVAIGAGTDVAIDSADIVLVRSDPEDILHLFALAGATARKIKQNLWWGAGYNIVAIPLAAGVLAPWGITLPPAAGAALMSLSTIIVAVNALTLRIDK